MNNVTAAYQMICIIAICVLLPITMASLRYKNKQYETRKKSDILKAAIEKNVDINVQDFLNKFNPPRKSFEEKMKTMLHLELLWGAILLIVGLLCMLVFILVYCFEHFDTDYITLGVIFGIIPIGIGAGLLVAHSNGKKTMEKNKAQS
ncbi:hypothetical protein [Segatella salivae]|uniref:hypothetical protein n=1 Tax=Segatella salivae TaxID=228604 RepID=UPI0028DC058D|nr:hypothetical protein [Segatella salivae]